MKASVTATDLLTPEEVASRWKIGGKRPSEAVNRMCREGTIPHGVAVQLGRFYRIRLDALVEWEAQGGQFGNNQEDGDA